MLKGYNLNVTTNMRMNGYSRRTEEQKKNSLLALLTKSSEQVL